MTKTFNPEVPWLVDASLGPDTTMEIASLEQLIEEEELETSLRPQNLDEFIGQPKLLSDLRVYTEAAKITGESLGHLLFSGPPGLGKTSLSQLIAAEMGTEMHAIAGPKLTHPEDLAALLLPLEDGDIVFVDEIHRIPTKVEECLYTAMEDFYLDLILGTGAMAKPVRIPLPKFTLVGATTHTGQMERPFLDRFQFHGRMELYDKNSIKRIVIRAARSMDKPINDRAAAAIARRARGTPRIAINHLKKTASYAAVLEEEDISYDIAEFVYENTGIDSQGLNQIERKYLDTLIQRFQGGPVGKVNLGAVLAEAMDSIEEIESYLIREGYIVKLNEGRMITTKGRKHMGYSLTEVPA